MRSSAIVCTNCGVSNQPESLFCQSCGSSLQTDKLNATSHPQTERLVAQVLLKQRYRISGPVGHGGMGAVYKAEDTQLGNRLVALKEMRQSGMTAPELQQAVDTFRQEATLLARLQHPNLPSIFDHFEEHGRWYLVMSFIEGETLKDYLSHQKLGKLPLGEVLQIGIQLCTVLSYLHLQHPAPIIFRDLKPANIMRTPDGHIYLIDFGIARHFKPGQTKDTAYYASTGYAPPEQYGEAQTTPRSDIYSLGVVLHQMLSGHNPSTTPFQMPSLLTQFPPLPPTLVQCITQMLELDEQRRPANVLAVRQILADHVTVSAQLPPPSPRLILPTVPADSPQVYAPGYQPPMVADRPPTYVPVLPSRGPRKTVVWLLLLVCIVAVSGSILYASFSHNGLSNPLQPASYPHLSSSYLGTVYDTTYNKSGNLSLFFSQNQQAISGTAKVFANGLMDSGNFTGTVGTDDTLQFTVTFSSGGVSKIVGTISSQNTLSGTYTTTYPNGISPNHQGTWEASPN